MIKIRFKRLNKLLESRERRKTGLTRVDGARELQRALDANLPVEILMVCPERLRGQEARRALAAAEARSRPALLLDEKLYEQLRFGERDEGLCAAVRWSPRSLTELDLPPEPLVLLLEAVEKPGNLGAVLRSADAAGADAVVLCDAAIEPSNPNAVRASLGTLFTVRLAQASSEEAISWLRTREIRLHAAVVDAAKRYTDCDLRGAVALAFGAEHAGLGDSWRGENFEGMSIPMRGKADSLNLSVAAGIVLYEALRQRSR